MEFKKTTILIVVSVVLIFLVLSVLTAMPYITLKDLKIEQSIYLDKIELIATNPTNHLIIFPETSLDVYIDGVHYGKLMIEKTEILSGETKPIQSEFSVGEGGLGIINEKGSFLKSSVVLYKGTATINFLGIKNNIPFEIEKTLNDQSVVVG